MIKILSDKIEFPSVDEATEEGLVAIGGDLSLERLKLAYKKGIFPWFNKEDMYMWWSPDPRFVLYPGDLKISKSMKKIIRDNKFSITYNTSFKEVVNQCSEISRKNQSDTWITDEMKESYIGLYKLGIAKSVEVWECERLVGGLYGIDLGNVFCGESMFSKVSNASKFGFITFIKDHNYRLIDCQMHTNHLESLGAKSISRELFLSYLK